MGVAQDMMPNAIRHEILTMVEAAAILRCSKAHLCHLLQGKVQGVPLLPFVAIGRRKLIRRIALMRWIESVENRCIQ